MSFAIYLLGYLVVIIGLGYGAYLAHMPAHWIAVGILILLGMGILTAVTRTRQKDPN
jgi:putative Mn2+ efflux pump MntP